MITGDRPVTPADIDTRIQAADARPHAPEALVERMARAARHAWFTSRATTDDDLWRDAAAAALRVVTERADGVDAWRMAEWNTLPNDVCGIDTAHLARQAEWSAATFGPGSREKGVTDHIRKELVEVAEATSQAEKQKEWIDVVILALDGAWRSGLSPQQIIDGVKAKQARNEARVWPDWRTADPDKAIEHDRSHDAMRVTS